MIDVHCHLLFGIDDGSKSLENSIKALNGLKNLGYTDIILTPHYIENTKYTSSKTNNLKLLEELKKELRKENNNINLYSGNEIFINYDILDLLKDNQISSLNDSDYLLIELPLSGEFSGYIDVFEELIHHGYKVILAHPERYLAFQKDCSKVDELRDLGVYFQSNLESITGGYGRHAKKMVKKLLKERKIQLLATDIHHAKKDYSDYLKAKKKICKYIDESEYDKLTHINPRRIIDNQNI